MPGVVDNRPPDAVLRVVNPVLRALVPSPAGRLLPGSVGVLTFTGRRSGRVLRIVAGVHEADGSPVVFTSRPWRLNFHDGRDLEVARSGRRQRGTATLVEDADEVATALDRVIADGVKPRSLGMRLEPGADDVRQTSRTLIRLRL